MYKKWLRNYGACRKTKNSKKQRENAMFLLIFLLKSSPVDQRKMMHTCREIHAQLTSLKRLLIDPEVKVV